MRSSKGLIQGLFVGVLLLTGTLLRADMAGAEAAYKAGSAKMKVKDYKGAAKDFSAALAEEPRYIYALRERGTCKFYLNDKPGALADYQAYSAKNPKDAKTAALVKKLEAQGIQPAAAAEPAKEGGFRWYHIFLPWKWF